MSTAPASAGASRLAALLALLAVALALATQFSIGRDAGVPDAQVGFVLAAIMLVVAMFIRPEPPAGSSFQLSRAWEWRGVVVVLGIALLFRIHRFYDFPPGLWYDEAINGTDAIAIMEHGNHLTVWRDTNFGHSTIYFYLLIASFKLFGFTMFAMRIVPVVAGFAAVAAFYLLARRLLGAVAALAATGLMAVSRYAVTFSRISWESSLEPLLEIMAVYFFVRALDTHRKRDWFMAGGSLAAGLYTYAAFRIVPFIMAFFVLYVAVTQWRSFRRDFSGLVFYFVSFVIVVAPLAQFVVRHTDQVTERQSAISVFNQVDREGSYAPLRHNIVAVAKMMNVRGDPNARHNLPGEPMLDGVSAALLVLGIAVAAWSFRDWRRGALLGWYVLALVPSAITISNENPSAIRTIGVIAPMFLLIGLAVDALHRALSVNPWGRAAFAAVVLALVAGAASINYHVLFDHQATDMRVYDDFYAATTSVAIAIAAESETAAVYVSDAFSKAVYVNGSFENPEMDVLDHGRTFATLRPALHVPVPASVTRDAAFILEPGDGPLEGYLVALYPDAKVTEVYDAFGRPNYTIVRIKADAVARLHAARAEYAGAPGGAPAATGSDSQLAHTWPQDLPADMSVPFRFSWSGVITIDPVTDAAAEVLPPPRFPGVKQLIFSSPGPVRLEMSGVGTREGRDSVVLDVPRDLPAGMYRYRAAATVESAGETKLEWATADGDRQPVPADALALDAPTGHGLLARHFASTDWSGPVVLRSLEPYPVPAGRLPPNFSVVMDGQLDVKEAGTYDFAVSAASPVLILVDGRTVVGISKPSGWQRGRGAVQMTAGPHQIEIRYVDNGWALFQIHWRPPGSPWKAFTGQEVAPVAIPPAETR